MRVVFAGGGTGGHVYPSIAVARALEAKSRAESEPLEMLYIGVRGRIDERIVPAEGIPFRAIAAGPLRVGSPLVFARNVAKLARGIVQARGLLREFRPRVVFATGGYASVPVGIAARLSGIPLVVFLPDVTPGWAVRLLSRLATTMATTSERALDHLPKRDTRVIGYPVRRDFWGLDRRAARAKLGLRPEGRLLLVTAGSLGARKINDAIAASLPELLAVCDVVHVTGIADEAGASARRGTLSADQQARYHVRGYLDDMPAAMVAADLVVSRAGASTLGELPAAATPAILVPGEYEGWSQAPNAEYLRDRGAAIIVRNHDLGGLGDTILRLLADTARLDAMREAMRSLARRDAARDLAQILWEEAA